MEIRAFALEQSGALLHRAALAIRRVARVQTPEAVHDVRVAIRRLEQCLQVFSDQFKRGTVKPLRRRLHAVLEAAALVRERDVAGDLCRQAGFTAPRTLGVQRRAAAKDLARIANAWNSAGLSPRKRVRSIDEDVLRQCARRFFKTGRKAQTRSAGSRALHAFRMVAKRFRYTLELFADADDQGQERKLKVLRRTLNLLGAISDCQSAARLLPDWAEMKDFLDAHERKHLEQFRKYWKKVADKPGEEDRWLRDLTGNA